MALNDYKRLITWKSGEQEAHYPEDKVKSCIEEIKQKINEIIDSWPIYKVETDYGKGYSQGWNEAIASAFHGIMKIIDKATGFNNSPKTQVQLLPAEKQSSSGPGQGLTGEDKTSPKKCIGCGCTDKQACPGGCYWMWEEYPVCSQCYEKHPGKYCKLLKKWEKERLEKKEAGK